MGLKVTCPSSDWAVCRSFSVCLFFSLLKVSRPSADSKIKASGKPSTWFPLEGHVQKVVTICFWYFFDFFVNCVFHLSTSHFLKKIKRITDPHFPIILYLNSCTRSFNMIRSYFLILHKQLYIKTSINSIHFLVNFTHRRSTEPNPTCWLSILM